MASPTHALSATADLLHQVAAVAPGGPDVQDLPRLGHSGARCNGSAVATLLKVKVKGPVELLRSCPYAIYRKPAMPSRCIRQLRERGRGSAKFLGGCTSALGQKRSATNNVPRSFERRPSPNSGHAMPGAIASGPRH